MGWLRQVADWLAGRALAIDRASGQISRAAELLVQGGAAGRAADVRQLQQMLAKGPHTSREHNTASMHFTLRHPQGCHAEVL